MHRNLGDFLTDLFQNSLEAGAKNLRVTLIQDEKSCRMTVADDGYGMTDQELVRAQDPFYTDGKKHPGRKVGLGLPFLIQLVEMIGGTFRIESQKGIGTSVEVLFPLKHLDTPPPGDWGTTMGQLLGMPGDFNVDFHRRFGNLEYRVTRAELKDALGNLEDLESLMLLKEYFLSAEAEIQEGELNG